MSLKLVHDATNVVEIDVYNPQLIPGIARTFADKVEAGDFGEVDRAIVILETDTGMLKFYWGNEIGNLEAVGMIQIALFEATTSGIDSYCDDAE